MVFAPKLKALVKENKPSEHLSLKVEISRFLFKDADSGYFVILVSIPTRVSIPEVKIIGNGGETISLTDRKFVAVGTSEQVAKNIIEGQEVELVGTFEEGREKGSIQMSVVNCIELMPTKPSAIQAFLSSPRFKGLGEATASKVVKEFGPQTLKVLEETPEKLLTIRGITDKKLELIKSSWATQKLSFEVLADLRALGIMEAVSYKIFETYGASAARITKEDPYALTSISGISFKTADEIASKLGILANDSSRINSGVQFVIQESSKNGNTYIQSQTLLEQSLDILCVEKNYIIKALKDLMSKELIVQGTIEQKYLMDKYTNEFRVSKVQGFSDIKLFKSEFIIAKELNRIFDEKNKSLPIYTQDDIDQYFGFNKDKLDESQMVAAKTILSQKVAVLTGGPGTGKTHTIKSLLNFFDLVNQKRIKEEKSIITYSLCAPTGRAAKRMNESTGRPSSTIHSLLAYNPAMGGFEHNAENPLDLDILIVDESSMIDVWVTAALLKAVPTGTTVIFIGDKDQLKSVGPGKVFHDLIATDMFAVARLLEIHRQALNSQIIRAAHSVIHNKMPELFYDRPDEKSDFLFTSAQSPSDIFSAIMQKVQSLIDKGVNPDDIQILTPKKAGEIGVNNLNEALRPLLNKKYAQYSYLSSKFVTGDRIMQLKNRKDLGIYNGDIGVVKFYDEENGSLKVIFDGKEVVLENADLKNITFAYASTVHKAQGSDYPHVIVPMSSGDWRMWDCNLLYTAITRAKNFLYIIGDESTMKSSVASYKQVERLTGLKEAIIERFNVGDSLDEKWSNVNMEEEEMDEVLEESVF